MDIDRDSVDVADREVVQFRDPAGGVIEVDNIFEFADFLGAHRGDDVLPRDRVDHVLRRQSVGLQLVLVEIDLDLQHLAAIRRRDRGSRDGRQLRTDEILPGVEYLRLREGVAGERQLQDRHARSIEAQDVGRGDAGRQKLEHGLRGGGYLRQRAVDVDPGLEEHLDHAIAGQRLRLDVRDVIDLRAEIALVVIDDATGHVVRRQSVVVPHDSDHRNADVGENVSRRLDRRRHAEDDDQHRHDDESVGLV